MQQDFFSSPCEELITGESQVRLYLNFLENKESLSLMKDIDQKVLWREDKITLFGKTHNLPRLQAWYGDNGVNYTYSKIKLSARSWFKELFNIKCKVEKLLKNDFNSVLINKYRNGSDYVAWHSDDEKELGEKPTIASLSLGECRKFALRNKFSKEKIELLLPTGSLLVMSGETQNQWEHTLPRAKKVTEERINFTFRKVY